jgi:hypothetical protein
VAQENGDRLECRYAMNEFTARVRVRDEAPLGYLDGFLDRGEGTADLPVLDLEPANPPGSPRWQLDVESELVDIAPSPDGYAVWSETASRFHIWTAARRLLRDLWLRRRVERGAPGFVHASALDDGRRLVVFVGDKRGGKTSLMLDGVLRHDWRLVANDCLVVFPGEDGVTACGLPTYAGIRADVADRFIDELRVRVRDDANLDYFRQWERAPRTGGEDKLFLSYGAISRPVFPSLPLADREITVVAVSFAPPGSPVSVRPLDGDPIRFLAANQKRLGFSVPDLAVGIGDGSGQLAELAARARFLSFRHAGDVSPVLTVDEVLAS